MKDKVQTLIPYLIILTSVVIIISRPNSIAADIAFLLIGFVVMLFGILLGRYSNLSYKPYFALLVFSLIPFIIASMMLFTQEQPECQDYAVLCISNNFVVSLVVFMVSGLAVAYNLGFLVPAVAIGKQLKQKKN